VGNTSTFALTPGQLAKLMALGTDGRAPREDLDADNQMAGLLRDRLADPLRFEREAINALPPALADVCRELTALANRPLGEVLLDPGTDLRVLEAVKEYGKRLAASQKDGREHAAALAIYYAAIAAALVFHRRRITRHTCGSLDRAFGLLVGKAWTPQDLAALFAKAREVCQNATRRS